MAIFEPQRRRLSELLDDIHVGAIQLPEFQRSYVWNRGRRYHLLDSMQKNYPVGTLLFLELSPRSPASAFNRRLVSGVDELGPAAKAEPEELILDGQQRLTSLYRAFSRSVEEWTCLDVHALFQEVGLSEGIEIDFEKFLKGHKPTKSSEELLWNKNLLPLYLVMPSKRERPLIERLTEYRESLKEDGQEELADFVVKVLPGYLESFSGYELPVVSLSKDLTISAIAGIFTELNNTGQKLSAFDLCVAKFFSGGVHLRDLLEDAKEKVEHFRNLDSDGTAALQYLAMLQSREGKPISSKKAKLVDGLEAEFVKANWSIATSSIGSLGNLLEEIGFGSSKTLPYDAVIPGLALAIDLLRKDNAKESEIRVALMRFIVGTGLSQRYTEGTDSKRESDVDEFREFVRDGIQPPHLMNPVNTSTMISTRLSGARFKSFLGICNAESPKDLISNVALGLDHPKRAQAEIHHVFPKSHLDKVSSKKIAKDRPWELALNTMLLSPESNKWVSNDPPSAYIARTINHLVEREQLSQNAAERRVRQSLEMQMIDGAAFGCMLKDDYEGFLTARAKTFALKLQELGLEAQFYDQVAEDDS